MTLSLSSEERRLAERELSFLTPRERDVALALCEGGDNQDVAGRLCIALPTLRTHLMRIHQKIGAQSRSDVVRYVAGRLLAGYRTGALVGGQGRKVVEVKALSSFETA